MLTPIMHLFPFKIEQNLEQLCFLRIVKLISVESIIKDGNKIIDYNSVYYAMRN